MSLVTVDAVPAAAAAVAAAAGRVATSLSVRAVLAVADVAATAPGYSVQRTSDVQQVVVWQKRLVCCC